MGITVITRAGARQNSIDCYVLSRHYPDFVCPVELLCITRQVVIISPGTGCVVNQQWRLAMNKVNFHAARSFHQSSIHTTINGWYFLARNRGAVGPFLSPDEMQLALQSFVKACVSSGDTGRRYSQHETAA